jgi:hypothetical protein
MMSCSRLSLAFVKNAYEMGTSNQHHVGSRALTTDRSMCPKDLITGRREDQVPTPKMPLSCFGGISLLCKMT